MLEYKFEFLTVNCNMVYNELSPTLVQEPHILEFLNTWDALCKLNDYDINIRFEFGS